MVTWLPLIWCAAFGVELIEAEGVSDADQAHIRTAAEEQLRNLPTPPSAGQLQIRIFGGATRILLVLERTDISAKRELYVQPSLLDLEPELRRVLRVLFADLSPPISSADTRLELEQSPPVSEKNWVGPIILSSVAVASFITAAALAARSSALTSELDDRPIVDDDYKQTVEQAELTAASPSVC